MTDREGHTALQDGQIDVFLPLVITTARLPAARVGVPYLASARRDRRGPGLLLGPVARRPAAMASTSTS